MKTKRRLLIAGIVIGSLLSLAPIFGLLGTAFGMMRAFATLGDAGIADPKALGDEIGFTLVSTATGFFLFPVGVLLLTLSLVFYFKLRATTPPPLPPRLWSNVAESREIERAYSPHAFLIKTWGSAKPPPQAGIDRTFGAMR